MNKKFAKIIINFYGIAFIVAAVAAVFVMHTKTIIGVVVLLFAGVALLRRKVFGVYVIFVVAFAVGAVGLLMSGLAINDLVHRLKRWDMFLIGLSFVIPSLLILYVFTRRAIAEEFGLSKIAILEKVNKKEVMAAVKVLLWIVGIIGAVLLFSYVVATLMSR